MLKPNTSQIQVLSRAANILRILGLSSAGLSLGQLAARTDLPRSTVQRIVSALVSEGLVLPLGGYNGFTLGPEIRALASTRKFDVWRSIHAHLVDLSDRTGETVDLAVLQGEMMLFIDQVPGRHRLRSISEPGERFSALVTANGKACLSLLSDKQLSQMSNVDQALYAEIDEIRHTGLGWDLGEHTPGISAIGSAFVGADGQRYAVSLPVQSMRFNTIKDRLAPQLLSCIAVIKQGYANQLGSS